MPNWVTTIMRVRGTPAQLHDFREFAREQKSPEAPDADSRELDFNKFIPMPASLQISHDSHAEFGAQLLLGLPCKALSYPWAADKGIHTPAQFMEWLLREHPEQHAGAGAMAVNYREHGHFSWYGWAVEHWGTKWNACDTEVLGEVPPNGEQASAELAYRLNTAWALPEPVLYAMSFRFPGLEFSGTFSEESDAFHGEFVGSKGEMSITTRDGPDPSESSDAGPEVQEQEQDEDSLPF